MPADDAPPTPPFLREVLRVYWFPLMMFCLAIVPGFNYTYSGHGGISWLIIPLCFPWVCGRACLRIFRGPEALRGRYRAFYAKTIPAYVALALPLSWAATTSIQKSFGLAVSPWSFFAIMVSPFPWWYFLPG